MSLLLALTACAGPPPRDAGTSPPPSPTASPTASPTGPAATSSGEPAEPEGTVSTSPLDQANRASVQRIGPRLARRMRFSHRPGCPVSLADLRLLRPRYVDLDGATRTGELVVHRDHARAVTGVFERLYDARWPIARMRLVDDYRADDDRSMAANNTSAYNCRRVAGSADWSEHAYGAAIDVNPVQNPYVTEGLVAPPAGRRFAAIDRARGATAPRGVIRFGDVVVRAFARIGWEWGGDWTSAKDYQHFSASGR
jgi:poly-gamma-glutamate synthesis protein (capsule biosynthesis protein)